MMKHLTRRLSESENGGALVFVAISLVLLMGIAAMGTDLAWFYLNSSRTQRAADGAALGGVIWMPGDQSKAFTTALEIAKQNGYDDSESAVAVAPATVPGEINQLEVSISSEVSTFFLRVLGFDTMTITETATAEYIPPLKLGSPENQFGNNCDPDYDSNCGDNFWANIHGVWTQARMGDAYASFCHDDGQGADDLGCDENEIYRGEGYLYGIESASPFALEFIDLAFHNMSDGEDCPTNMRPGASDPPQYIPEGCTSDWIRTGDRGCEDTGWGATYDPDCGPTMVVNLYAPDPTPLDLSDNGGPVCSATIPPQPQIGELDSYTWDKPDGKMCWSQSGPGTWVVQVTQLHPGAIPDRSGLNRYSVRSTTGQLFALRDFSIYNNAEGTETEFFLAEVPHFYAGKTLVIELYDPGEASDNGTLEVIGPDGTVWDGSQCRVYDRDDTTDPWSLQNTIPAGSDCEEPVQSVPSKEYHDRWLKFEIDLPADYGCDQVASECWWKMNYDYPSGVNDTTTWRAFIIGNPIHLTS